jgi:palmitoyltransferase ZDHHC9/14/18
MGGGGRVFDKSLLDGNNRSWLGGRSLTGPHIRGLLFSSITIAVAAGIAFGISFPWLLHKHPALAYPLLVVFTVALAISLAAGWLTGTTDPGIIPRSAAAPPDIQRNPGRPRERRLVLRGRQIVTKYCETCRIWRPPHASHCSTCNNCVDRFDHHCPYCSGCIGRRNYRSFLTFVVSTAVLSAVAVAAAVAHIILKTRDFQRARSLSAVDALGKTLSDGPTAANVIVIVIAALALAFTGGLTGFHLYLMWNNMTTAESFKKANRNSISDSDDLRGLRAIWHLISVKRPDSRITAGYDGPPYPDAREVAALIEAQDEDDALALPPPAGVDRLPLTGARVPSAASRLAKLSAGFAAAEEARTEAKV